MSAVFADTFYFLAILNRNDNAHSKCVRYSETADQPIVTTDWVLLELGDALRKGRDRSAFSTLVRELADDPDTIVISANQFLFEQALQLFDARPDKEWSLTDCTSFVVMQEQGLTQALTKDRHFEQAGYIALFA